MTERNNHSDPWACSSYETGSTQPPKNHGGLIAVLLVLVIFFGGLSCALGALNARLSSQLNTGSGDQPVIFLPTASQTDATKSTDSSNITDTTLPSSDSSLQLHPVPEAVENIPQEGGLSLQEIYTTAIPSVVSISCTTEEGSSSGTGVVLTQNGYLVTNCHVVQGAETIQVQFTDDRVLSATLVGADAVSDLAVLYVPAEDLIPAQFGDSSNLRVGDAVAAIGDPLGEALRGTMTNGIVSAINREVNVGNRIMTLVQTNAALNSGNSGGPLLNCYGQVIGINTMKISAFVDSSGVEGLGFAIPSTTVKEIVDQLISQGYVSGRPSLGFSGEAVSLAYQRYYRLPAGIYITDVFSDTSAERVGIQPGDILLQLGDTRITDTDSLNSVLYSLEAGDLIEAVIYRNGRQYTATLLLGEAKE